MAHAMTLGTPTIVALCSALAVAAFRSGAAVASAASDLWLAVEAGEPEGEPRPSRARRAGHFALTLLALSLPAERAPRR